MRKGLKRDTDLNLVLFRGWVGVGGDGRVAGGRRGVVSEKRCIRDTGHVGTGGPSQRRISTPGRYARLRYHVSP